MLCPGTQDRTRIVWSPPLDAYIFKARFFYSEDRLRILEEKTFENVRFYHIRINTNSRYKVETAINRYIFIIKTYLLN